jgi:hypothetical protein
MSITTTYTRVTPKYLMRKTKFDLWYFFLGDMNQREVESLSKWDIVKLVLDRLDEASEPDDVLTKGEG